MLAQPLWGYVLIQPLIIEKKSKTGLVLPEQLKQGDFLYGTIIKFGLGSIAFDGSNIPINTKLTEGRTVVFEEDNTKEIILEGSKYYLVEQRNIIAVL